MRERVVIVGGGQMAVMLARLVDDAGHRPTLLARGRTLEALRATGRSPYLPDATLPASAGLTDDPACVADARAVLLAVPTQSVRAAASGLPASDGPAVSCAKGFELDTLLRPSQVVADAWKAHAGPVAVLSGPNVAGEVVARKPAGAVVASPDPAVAAGVRELLMTPYFRIYTNDDVVGVELAGAVKNVIALAAGIIDGLGLGNNAKASLLTRGLVELGRLGCHLGARPETFAGLAGLGDMITTCVSPEGRNRTAGERIGRGQPLGEVLASIGSVCEGVPTTRALRDLGRRHGVEMPIVESVHAVLFEDKPVADALHDLMTRDPKPETA